MANYSFPTLIWIQMVNFKNTIFIRLSRASYRMSPEHISVEILKFEFYLECTVKPHGKRLMGPKIYRSSRNRLSQGLLLCIIVSKS